MTAMRHFWPVALVAVVLTGCGSGSTARPPSEEPSGSSAPSAAERGSIPAGCQPIDLLAPTGERVDLTGEWAGTGSLASAAETTWLNQVGGCVYGSVIGGLPLPEVNPRSIANLTGRIGSDFRIAFEIVIVTQSDVFAPGEYSTMEMLIEWDPEGRLLLREDRAPGETAGRCIQTVVECPVPLVWFRVGDSPSP